MAEYDKRQQKTFKQGRKQISGTSSRFVQLPLVAAMDITFFILLRMQRLLKRLSSSLCVDRSICQDVCQQLGDGQSFAMQNKQGTSR